jgi:hypothetical protein
VSTRKVLCSSPLALLNARPEGLAHRDAGYGPRNATDETWGDVQTAAASPIPGTPGTFVEIVDGVVDGELAKLAAQKLESIGPSDTCVLQVIQFRGNARIVREVEVGNWGFAMNLGSGRVRLSVASTMATPAKIGVGVSLGTTQYEWVPETVPTVLPALGKRDLVPVPWARRVALTLVAGSTGAASDIPLVISQTLVVPSLFASIHAGAAGATFSVAWEVIF